MRSKLALAALTGIVLAVLTAAVDGCRTTVTAQDRVLDTYARTDAYLAERWHWLQTQPDYRGRTHLLMTTDHGRGQQTGDWKDHGERVVGADITWMAFASSSMPRRGEWRDHSPLQNAQVAATLLHWLKLEPRQLSADAAGPVP